MASAAAAARGVAGPPAVSIYSTAGSFEVLPPSAQAILGDYVVDGVNHGRRVYRRKKAAAGGKKGLPEIVLFFWDSRDGKDLSGWWLGDRVGGGQVWARNRDTSTLPPRQGWHCPVDGPAQKNVVCEGKDEDQDEMDGEGDGEADWADWKRPAPAGGLPPPKRPAKLQTLVFTSKLDDDEKLGDVKRLLGEYLQQGTNHGKKTFLKQGSEDEDTDDPPVWLYYWDGRDGPESSGWWLGRTVGGNEVYAWASQHSSVPASRGWRVPHKGLVRHDVTLLPKAHDEEAHIAEKERLAKGKDLVKTMEEQIDKALQTASSVLNVQGDVFEEGVRAVNELLQTRVRELEEAAASLSRHVRAAKRQDATQRTEAELHLLEERLDVAKGKLTEELSRSQEALDKVDQEQAEEQGAKAIEEALPSAMEMVTQAELAADAAQDSAAADAARQLLKDAVQEVKKTLDAARSFAPEARRIAMSEFSQLQARCESAGHRLDQQGFDASGADPGDPKNGDSAADPAASAVAAADEEDVGSQAGEIMMALAVEAPEDGDSVGSAVGDDEDLAAHAAGDDDDDGPAGGEAEAASRLLLAAATGPRKRPADEDAWAANVFGSLGASAEDARRRAVEALEGAEAAMTRSTAAAAGNLSSETARLYADTLRRKEGDVRAAQKALAQALATATRRDADVDEAASEEDSKVLTSLASKLQDMQSRIQKAMSALKRGAVKEKTANQHAKGSSDALAMTLEAVDRAETAVEALVLRVDDAEWWRTQLELKNVHKARKAVDAAQVAAEAAEIAAADARGRLELARNSLDSQVAARELAPARSRLAELQRKLVPFRQVRVMFELQVQAREELDSLAQRIEAADRAAGRQADGTEEATRAAQADLERVLQHLAPGVYEPPDGDDIPGGGIREALEQRAEQLYARAMVVAGSFEERKAEGRQKRQQAQGEALLDRAREAVERAEVWLPHLVAAQEPWAGSREVLDEGEDPTSVLDEAVTAVGSAEKSATAAQMLLLESLAEARRLPDALGAVEGLEVLQARADAVALRVSQLKADTADRRAKAQMTEAVRAIIACEIAVAEVSKAAGQLAEDNLDGSSAPAGLAEICSKILQLEPAAAQACTDAQEALASRQEKMEGTEGSELQSMFMRLSARHSAAAGRLAGLKRAALEAPSNWEVLQGQKAALSELEAKVDEAELVNLPLGDEREPSEAVEDARASSAQGASQALAKWRAAAEALASNPHGAMKLAMGRLLERSLACRARLKEVEAMGRSWRERALCRVFLREAQDAIARAEHAFTAAEETETRFLKGIEVSEMEPAEANESISVCEAALGSAAPVLAEVQATLSYRRREVLSFRCLDEAQKTDTTKQLEEHSTRVSALAAKLGQFRRDLKTRKAGLASATSSLASRAAAAAAAKAEAEAKPAEDDEELEVELE